MTANSFLCPGHSRETEQEMDDKCMNKKDTLRQCKSCRENNPGVGERVMAGQSWGRMGTLQQGQLQEEGRERAQGPETLPVCRVLSPQGQGDARGSALSMTFPREN